MSLKTIIENSDTKEGKTFDLTIQSLIILSLISFSLETLPNLSPQTKNILSIFEIFCLVIFSIEYLLRIIVATRKVKFIFSFYGLIDLLAILPFYFSLGIDLRSIRIFRIFRLLRTFKMLRYNSALTRLGDAFISVRAELNLFLIITIFIIYLASVGIYYFENEVQPENFSSIFHCMWWAVSTLTTVGYGDIYPITVGGKIFTSFIVLIGIGIVAVPTGLIATAFSSVSKKNNES